MDLAIRHIEPHEYGLAHELWNICFPEDAPDYSEYYFRLRTRPEYVLAAFHKNRLIGALHALPYPIVCFGRVKRCVMVAGVATLPEYRHKGVAARLINACHEEQRKNEVIAALLKPDVDFYAQFGYVPFSYKDNYALRAMLAGIPAPLHEPDAGEMLRLYSEYSKGFCGMMDRTLADMQAYIEEVNVLKGYALSSGEAYALYTETEDGANVYELVGEKPDGLINSLAEEYGEVHFSLPHFSAPIAGASYKGTEKFSMICVLDEAGLIKDTPATSAAQLISGEIERVNTLEFC